MLINCNSCQKKFIVPDNAITESGRLVQCGSCGKKWTQFPTNITKSKETKILQDVQLKKPQVNKKKTIPKKTVSKKNLYTAEYLKKKHGLTIQESNITLNNLRENNKNSFGFYSYMLFLFIFLITMFGILDLSKAIIILKYPNSEMYINYLYEVIEIIKVSITVFVNQFYKLN
jgi:predicted Zn finger-like uncharacterized protein